ARPAAIAPLAAHDRCILRLPYALGLVRQRSIPRLLGLEGVVHQQAWVLAQGITRFEPALLPATHLLHRPDRQFLGRDKAAGVCFDRSQSTRFLKADTSAGG